jgi:hypothetical protein
MVRGPGLGATVVRPHFQKAGVQQPPSCVTGDGATFSIAMDNNRNGKLSGFCKNLGSDVPAERNPDGSGKRRTSDDIERPDVDEQKEIATAHDPPHVLH